MSSRVTCKSVSLCLGGLLALGSGRPLAAQSATPAQSVLEDKVVFDGGVFITDFQMKARLDGQFTQNPDYDFDRTFGGKNSNATRFRADGLWRVTPAHHLRVMYFNNTRTRSRDLDQDFVWGDATYHVGAHLALQTKQEIVELAYEWAFLRTPTYEVAGTFGVHYTSLSLELSGSATGSGSGGGSVTASYTTQKNDLPVPLPVLGIRAGWAVSSNWYLDASGQVFKAKVGKYDGLIQDLRANATWMFSNHVGAGLGYNVFTTNLEVAKRDFSGRLRYGYSGFQAFVKVGF